MGLHRGMGVQPTIEIKSPFYKGRQYALLEILAQEQIRNTIFQPFKLYQLTKYICSKWDNLHLKQLLKVHYLNFIILLKRIPSIIDTILDSLGHYDYRELTKQSAEVRWNTYWSKYGTQFQPKLEIVKLFQVSNPSTKITYSLHLLKWSIANATSPTTSFKFKFNLNYRSTAVSSFYVTTYVLHQCNNKYYHLSIYVLLHNYLCTCVVYSVYNYLI